MLARDPHSLLDLLGTFGGLIALDICDFEHFAAAHQRANRDVARVAVKDRARQLLFERANIPALVAFDKIRFDEGETFSQ